VGGWGGGGGGDHSPRTRALAASARCRRHHVPSAGQLAPPGWCRLGYCAVCVAAEAGGEIGWVRSNGQRSPVPHRPGVDSVQPRRGPRCSGRGCRAKLPGPTPRCMRRGPQQTRRGQRRTVGLGDARQLVEVVRQQPACRHGGAHKV
jgi:hypothetical protein